MKFSSHKSKENTNERHHEHLDLYTALSRYVSHLTFACIIGVDHDDKNGLLNFNRSNIIVANATLNSILLYLHAHNLLSENTLMNIIFGALV
jgi:hypothetical protein